MSLTPALWLAMPLTLLHVQAEVTSVAGAGPINDWAARVTNGAITEVVPADLSFSMVSVTVSQHPTWEGSGV